MDIGFDTIGNATLICYDKGPVLTTDPWLGASAYFGSWILKHPIPEEQLQAISECKFVWLSHGHPDHLHSAWLDQMVGKTILLPDHVGRRIEGSLSEKGHVVKILPDRQWVALSDRIRVCCIADYNQDAVLLIDVNGRLLFNMNDAGDQGWAKSVKKIIRGYDTSFLLKGSGLADMANFYDEDGDFMAPIILPSGPFLANLADSFGVTHFIPFSSNHYNQRSDSAWAEEYSTSYEDYRIGFSSEQCQILPPFIRYDCANDTFTEIAVTAIESIVEAPEKFGDDWSAPVDKGDFAKIERYFHSISHLFDFLDFINFRVGGQDHHISFNKEKFRRGVTFGAPRNSLMTCIEYEIFDDMLIGNFMKTTLHGKWSESKLYPEFGPYITKYADNGHAKYKIELRSYMEQYRRRAPLEFLMHRLEFHTKNTFRNYVTHDSRLYSIVRGLYHRHA